MNRYIIEYEVLHRQGQVVWSEMKAYPTIFTDKNIDEAEQIVNILSQIHNDCNIVKLEECGYKDDVYHHDAFKENQGDCDRCIYNNRKLDSDVTCEDEDVSDSDKNCENPKSTIIKRPNIIEYDNSTNYLQHLIDICVAPRCICAKIKNLYDANYWCVLWLHEPKDTEALKTYYYYDESGEEMPTANIEKFIMLD